jgi:hypothetical protein
MGALQRVDGQLYTLVDNNSQLDIQLTVSPIVHDTVYNWRVEGTDHLAEFSNWYRVGGGREFPLSSVPVTVVDDTQPDQLVVLYTDTLGRFSVQVTYGVFGGGFGSGYSKMGECVTIKNLQDTASLNFHFFEYMNLDLDATPGSDTAVRTSPVRLQQDDVVDGTTFNVSYGASDHHEIAYSPSLLTRLDDNFPTTLGDVPVGFSTPIGPPGDMEWALQWDFVLSPEGQPGDSYNICKDCELQMIIPEPTSFLGMIGGVAMGWIGVRRRR